MICTFVLSQYLLHSGIVLSALPESNLLTVLTCTETEMYGMSLNAVVVLLFTQFIIWSLMRIKYLKLRSMAHLLSLECVHCS